MLELIDAWIEERWQGNLPWKSVLRYIDYLGLVRSDESVRRLLHILEQLLPSGRGPSPGELEGDSEQDWALLTVAVLTSLGEAGKPALGRQLLPYLSCPYSSVAATAAKAVATLRGDDLDQECMGLCAVGSGQVRVLAAPLAAQSVNPALVRTLLREVYCDNPDSLVELALRSTTDPDWLEADDVFVNELLDDCMEGARGTLLSMTSLMACLDSRDRIVNLIVNEEYTFRTRVAALETSLRLDPIRAPEILEFFLNSQDDLMIRAAIAVLTSTGNRNAHDLLIERVGPSSPEWLVNSCVRLFSVTPSRQTERWVIRCLTNSSPSDALRMRLIMTASASRNRDVLPMVAECLTSEGDDAVMRRAVAYQSLAMISTEEAAGMLIERLEVESDLSLISIGIDALGSILSNQVERFLLRIISPSHWPDAWPPPQPPLPPGGAAPC